MRKLIVAVKVFVLAVALSPVVVNAGKPIDYTNRDLNLPLCTRSDAVNLSSQFELSKINKAQGRVICVNGNFNNTELKLEKSGTAKKPLIYRFGGSTFRHLEVKGSHLIIDGLHVDRGGRHGVIRIRGKHVTITNSLFERADSDLLRVEAANVVIKDSILRDTYPKRRKDRHCIVATGSASGLQVTGNQIYDCAGDGLQIAKSSSRAPANVLIANNEIYLTSKLYRSGNRACAEEALDFKAGRNVRVIKNVMHGFRKTNSGCGGTGSNGNGIVVHLLANDYLIEKNRIIDSNGCIWVGRGGKHKTKNIVIRNNVCKR